MTVVHVYSLRKGLGSVPLGCSDLFRSTGHMLDMKLLYQWMSLVCMIIRMGRPVV